MKDVFKSLGINVGGDQSLIKSGESKINAGGDISSDVVRKGSGISARDMLEHSLAKGGFEFKKQKLSPYAEPEGERVENPSLKDTHGEMFHSDNDKQAEELQSSAEVIDQDFDGEDQDPKRKAKKRGGWDYAAPGEGEGKVTYVLFKKSLDDTDIGELFLRGIEEPVSKGGRPMPKMGPSSRAPRQPKDPVQAKQERALKREAMRVGKSEDSLIEYAPDPFSPRTIKNVHENSRGVIEKRRPSIFPELQRSMAMDKLKKKGKLVEWAKEEEEEHEMDKSDKLMKRAPKGVDPAKHERCVKEVKRQGHDVGSAHAICTSSMKKSEIDELFDIIKGEKMISTPKKEMVEEHEKLVDVLESPSRKDDKKEAVKQKKELQGYKQASCAKKSFIKSAGQGGIVFDFGLLTGNPIADNATMLLNQHADPIQAETAKYQRDSFSKALGEYTAKGDAAYSGEATPFGNVEKGWADQLNKPMDQQVAEAFKAGEFVEKGQPASRFGDTKMNLGGSTIHAMSETDAAVIEMMKSQGMDLTGLETGTIVDASGGGKIKITAGE